MQQVWTGPPRDARELVRSLKRSLNVDAIAMTRDALGRVNVYVQDADAADVREALAISRELAAGRKDGA